MEGREEGVGLPPASKIEQTPASFDTNSTGGTRSVEGSARGRSKASHDGSADTDDGLSEGRRAALTVADRKRSYSETYCFGAVPKRAPNGASLAAASPTKISVELSEARTAPSPEPSHSSIARVPSIAIAIGKTGYAGESGESCERSSRGSTEQHPDADRTSPPPFQRDGSEGLLANATGPLVRDLSDSSVSTSGAKQAAKISSRTGSFSVRSNRRTDLDDGRSRRIKKGPPKTQEASLDEEDNLRLASDSEEEASSRRDDISLLEQSYSASMRDDQERHLGVATQTRRTCAKMLSYLKSINTKSNKKDRVKQWQILWKSLDPAEVYQTTGGASYLLSLFGQPIGSFSFNLNVDRVKPDMPIIDVLRQMSTSRAVIVERWCSEEEKSSSKEIMICRSKFFEVVSFVQDLSRPLSSVLHAVPLVPTLPESSTLERVWKAMTVMRCEEIGCVSEDGDIMGMISYEDVYNFLINEAEKGVVQSRHEQEQRRLADLDGNGDAVDDDMASDLLDLLKPYVDNFAHWVTTMALLFIALAGVLEKQPTAGMTPMNAVLGVINLVFLLDSIYRVTALRWEIFTFRRLLDLVDAIMIWISVIGYISWLQGGLPVMTMRILTFMHAITGFKAMGFFEKFVEFLEKNRRRFRESGFDLDLAFVTPTVVALSSPEVEKLKRSRNALDEVSRMFLSKHRFHFIVFDLSPHDQYDRNCMDNNVVNIHVEKGCPPLIDQLVNMVLRAYSFLESNPINVIAVTSSKGLGRAGVAIAAWLLYSRYSTDAQKAMKTFACHRTLRGNAEVEDCIKGVSQQRYVSYIQKAFQAGGYDVRRIMLEKVILNFKWKDGMVRDWEPCFVIKEGFKTVYEFNSSHKMHNHNANDDAEIYDLRQGQVDGMLRGRQLSGDIKIYMYKAKGTLQTQQRPMCFSCFHTGFIRGNSLYFEKYDIDMASEDLGDKIFPPNFSIELIFATPRSNDSIFRKIKPPEQHMVNRSIRQRAQNEILPKIRRTSSIISWLPRKMSDAAALWSTATNNNASPLGRQARKKSRMSTAATDVSEDFAQSPRRETSTLWERTSEEETSEHGAAWNWPEAGNNKC